MRWCWVNFQCRASYVFGYREGQGPTAFTVGVGGVVWTFFSRLSFLFFLPLSGRRPDVD